MKGVIFFALALLLIGLPATSMAKQEKRGPSTSTAGFVPVAPPQSLTPLSFLDANGTVRHLNEFKGRVILVNLWASWCPPCIRELPALDRLQKTFGGGEFMIVALSVDRQGRVAAEKTFRRLGIENLALYTVPTEVVAETFPADVLPANFILNREGKLTSYLRSYVNWDDRQTMAFVFEQILAAD